MTHQQEGEALSHQSHSSFLLYPVHLSDNLQFNIGARLPAVIGGDLVGTVLTSGHEVSSSFPAGATVFAQCNFLNPSAGGLQEYTVINGEYAGIVPANISITEAALYPINAMTSAVALFTPDGFDLPFPGTPEAQSFDYPSQTVVIIGGGSNTGKLAIQLARIAGIGTIIAIASKSNEEVLKSYGATHVIARQDKHIEKQVRDVVGDDLIHVLDTINTPDRTLALSMLSNTKQGILAHLTPGSSSEVLRAQKEAGVRESGVQGFSHRYPEFGRLFWKIFPEWLESGRIKSINTKSLRDWMQTRSMLRLMSIGITKAESGIMSALGKRPWPTE